MRFWLGLRSGRRWGAHSAPQMDLRGPHRDMKGHEQARGGAKGRKREEGRNLHSEIVDAYAGDRRVVRHRAVPW